MDVGIYCCKDCEKRKPGCHDRCDIFKKQKFEYRKIVKKEEKERYLNKFLDEFCNKERTDWVKKRRKK